MSNSLLSMGDVVRFSMIMFWTSTSQSERATNSDCAKISNFDSMMTCNCIAIKNSSTTSVAQLRPLRALQKRVETKEMGYRADPAGRREVTRSARGLARLVAPAGLTGAEASSVAATVSDCTGWPGAARSGVGPGGRHRPGLAGPQAARRQPGPRAPGRHGDRRPRGWAPGPLGKPQSRCNDAMMPRYRRAR